MQKSNANQLLLKDMFCISLYSILSGIGGALLFAMMVLLMNSAVHAETPGDAGMANLPPMATDEVRRGSLLLKLASGGVSVDAPMLKTDVEMDVSGMIARVSVRQRFRNPDKEWVEGEYVFPLPEKAAVDRMRLKIGERMIEGEIQEKSQARKTYEQAKRAGKKASLLSQQRPNIFSTRVANIGPGEEVLVEIEYQQDLRYENGRFNIRFPLVVAPRYIPGTPLGRDEVRTFSGSGWALDTDQVTDASHITPPVIDPVEGEVNNVSITVKLAAGFPLARLESTYHQIESTRDENNVHTIRLSGDEVIGDRDFELTWSPQSGSEPYAALFNEQWQGGNYSLVMVMPPRAGGAGARIPREMVFVIDTSGSMHGDSIAQAKEALKMALARLTPDDRFNIIQFNSTTHSLFAAAVVASRRNLERAGDYVDALSADGGTEMLPALEAALNGNEESGWLRQVVFMTDGSVGNESALFEVIERKLGDSRLFTVGIGSAPNSFFMTRAAKFGRGTFTYIGKVSEVRSKMGDLFRKLESPVLNDLEVEWGEGAQVEVWPRRIPDLYQGEPLVLAVKGNISGKSITVRGKSAAHPWKQQVNLQGGGDSPGVHLLWVRKKIADLMDQKVRGRSEREVREEVLELALEHRLVSKYTSLVAVDKTPSRPVDQTLTGKNVPVHLPRGWSANKVFGSMPQTATPALLNLLLGMLAMISGWLVSVIGKRRQRGVC
ncbi:MAG: marine proteobacterial sortase target protein [Candidatus Sedimenticola sp. PURPLELP]